MHYAVIDIGSPRQGNLGWWITGPFIEDGGTGPEDMIASLTEAVRAGPVVLGFEAPMYVPAKRDIRATIQQRPWGSWQTVERWSRCERYRNGSRTGPRYPRSRFIQRS